MKIDSLINEYNNKPDKDATLLSVKAYCKRFETALQDTVKYNDICRKRITTLEQDLATAKTTQEQFNLNITLSQEYSILNVDRMRYYAQGALKAATALKNRDYIAQASIQSVEADILCGYFREADKALCRIDTVGCSTSTQVQYLLTCIKLEFENGFYYPIGSSIAQNMKGVRLRLSKLLPPNSKYLDMADAYITFGNSEYSKAISCIYLLLEKLDKNSPEYSYWVGNLGYNLMGRCDFNEAMKYMTESAMIEVKRGSKGYPALRKIAELLYVVGDIESSYRLISHAMDNAIDYGSKYRISEVSKCYPLIDKQFYNTIKIQQQRLSHTLMLLGVIVVSLIISLSFSIVQRRKVKSQYDVINRQNEELTQKSTYITEMNTSLLEAHRIKDVALGRVLSGSASAVQMIDDMKRNLLRKLKVKDYEGMRTILEKKEELDSYQLDHLILEIFPHFVEQFNALLSPEQRITPKQEHTLTPEMRIFALIRLGVSKNEELGRCLDYSVNTIKSYKNKIVTSSIYEKSDFYDHLMNDIAN